MVIAMAVGLAGCAATVGNLPHNQPAVAAQAPQREAGGVVGSRVVALSFSGGGLRAAAFALGALQGLDDVPAGGAHRLLDDVAFITSVSGGSITAAYFGLHGRSALATLRSEGFTPDAQADLRTNLLNPLNIERLLAGGLNDTSSLHRWLETDIFKGAQYADLFRHGRPVIWINATDLYHRMPFAFNQRTFDALCSDLASYPVSEAVAASMAVPLVFAPVVLEKHPDRCATPLPSVPLAGAAAAPQPMLRQAIGTALRDYRDVRTGRYLKLVDGGITDNYGLTSLEQARVLQGAAYSPFTQDDAVRVRRLLFVVVDGGQVPAGNWNQELAGPGGLELAGAAIDAAIATNVRMSFDSFDAMVGVWRSDVVRYRCELPEARKARLRAIDPGWRCDDVSFVVARISFDDLGTERAQRLMAIPIRLALPGGDLDALIAAGREAISRNPNVRAFVAGE